MTQSNAYPETARKRHWMYGANAVILVIIVVIVVAFIMILTASSYARKAKWDLTANGTYSLSGYTQQLLKRLDEKKEKYELINVFRPSDERQQQVQDILDEYARASNNLTVSDLSQVSRDQIVEKIRSR